MITSIIQSSSDDLRRNTLSCDRAIKKKSKTSPLTLYFFVSCSVRGKHSLLVMYNWAASAFNYKWLCPFERANESPLTQHIPNGFADLSVRPWARPPGERQTVRNRRVNIAVFQRQGEKWMFLDNSGVMSSGSSSCRDELLFKVTFWRVGFTSAHWLRFTKEKGETFNLPHLKKVSVCSWKKKKKKPTKPAGSTFANNASSPFAPLWEAIQLWLHFVHRRHLYRQQSWRRTKQVAVNRLRLK